MPFYEYECQKCGHHLEAMQKITDAPLRKCPDCGRPALKKLISSPVFRLKGSGWYETDFKSDKEARRNIADRPEKEEKKEDKTKGESKPAVAAAEAKPESKSETKTESPPKPAANGAATRRRASVGSSSGKRVARRPK
jgi:putative FmdB family regulatory protein